MYIYVYIYILYTHLESAFQNGARLRRGNHDLEGSKFLGFDREG
jgi:hypothetical protein